MFDAYSPVQKKWLASGGIFLGLVLAGWIAFGPTYSIRVLYQTKKELKGIQEDIARLEQENTRLRTEIDLLKNDPAYLEEVARKEHGLLKKNEIIYQFSSRKKK